MGRRIGRTLAAAGLTAAALTAGTVVATDAHRAAPVSPAVATAPEDTAISPVASTSEAPYPDLSSVAREVSDAVTAASRGTSVGFVLYDRESDKELASLDADSSYYTASLVKLLIAIDEVHADGTWALPDADAVEDLTDMLEGSNDAIASEFWERNGGNAIVTRTAALIGLTHTTPPTDPTQWGMARTSASDVVATYEYLLDVIPDEVAAPLLAALAGARNPADDGWDQYFGIPDGLAGRSWQIKQGWMILRNALVLNTTGVVSGRYVVVLLTQQPAVSSAKGRAAVTAGIKTLGPLLTQLDAT
ncbi:hypothetical protein SAMN05421837_10297 [Amycolatopsis pretoriensis]|uniref:Beta-lactamase class A n=1 Tax=Amycolatopsis pretoriensis TaxID=218821 RepID=A0A1H5QB49_9PSEU|nr:hypothetical protein [Amycolatopsis pretoriensis]SEF23275.1 hypothetical protein SAMN05421837_10297 [Amycolatopsis pretoriensis]